MPFSITTASCATSAYGIGESPISLRCMIATYRVIVRPTNSQGERVTPSDFEVHRASHVVLGPCCLCPFQHQDAGDFKESVVFMAGFGRFTGEYVAACANGQCDYFGKNLFHPAVQESHQPVVLMERLHANRGTVIRQYPVRGQWRSLVQTSI
jgi:hypothetical protein